MRELERKVGVGVAVRKVKDNNRDLLVFNESHV